MDVVLDDDWLLWAEELALHEQWVCSDEGREWANRWLNDQQAQTIPSELFQGADNDCDG